MKEFSICIPYYRGADVIEHCLGSVFDQEGVSPDDIEVILTADSASGACNAALARMERQFPVQIVRNRHRLGLTGNWNKALGLGRGRIRTLLHQDDGYTRTCLARVREAFGSDPSLAVYSAGSFYDAPAGTIFKERPLTGRFSGPDYLRQLATLREIPAPTTMFFRSQALERLSPGTEFYSSKYAYCPEAWLYAQIALNNPEMFILHDGGAIVKRLVRPIKHGTAYLCDRFPDIITFLSELAGLGAHSEDVTLTARDVTKPIAAIFPKLDTIDPVLFKERIDQIKRCTDGDNFHLFSKALPDVATATVASLSETLRKKIAGVPYSAAFKRIDAGERSLNRAFLGNVHRSLIPKSKEGDPNALPDPVIITGFHHSGTRLVAKLLNECGLFQPVNTPTHEWRYIQLLNMVEEPDYLDPGAVSRYRPRKMVTADKENLLGLISGVFGHACGPWGFKEPRTTFTIAAWLDAFPEAKIIHVVRDPMDVLLTLPPEYGELARRGRPPQRDVLHWAELWMEYELAFRDATRNHPRVATFRFEDVCLNPAAMVREVAERHGLGDTLRLSRLETVPDSNKIGVWKSWLDRGDVSAGAVGKLRSAVRGHREIYDYVSKDSQPFHPRAEAASVRPETP